MAEISEAMMLLAREYISKINQCDECFCEMWCIDHETKDGRTPYKGCECNLICYLSEKFRPKSTIVHCSECKHWDTEECPMCHRVEWYDDDDGWDYSIENKADYDKGFCDIGERFKDIEVFE